PARGEGRFCYFATPDYFADCAREAQQAGVAYIGGCCGTTPAHIAAMRDALKPKAVSQATARQQPAAAPIAIDLAPTDQLPPTPFAQKLHDNGFVISVEIDPPRGLNPPKHLAGAQPLKDAGAGAIDLGDGPLGRGRAT